MASQEKMILCGKISDLENELGNCKESKNIVLLLKVLFF